MCLKFEHLVALVIVWAMGLLVTLGGCHLDSLGSGGILAWVGDHLWHFLVICEGFLGLFPGGTPKAPLVDCLWNWVPSSCVGSSGAQVLGLVWCLLALEPPSVLAFTTGTSVPASMWTSWEKLCVNCLLGFHLVFIDWLIVSCHDRYIPLYTCIYICYYSWVVISLV
jgi:hypothetical protein